MKREEFVQMVRDCGQSVIDNAEKIYNTFEYPYDGVKIEIDIDMRGYPSITVTKKYLPESFIERISVAK